MELHMITLKHKTNIHTTSTTTAQFQDNIIWWC